jgi:hypothetical protein
MANPSSGHQSNDRSLENRPPELRFAAVFGGKCVDWCGPDADDKPEVLRHLADRRSPPNRA